jgi:hypothetical protein
MNMTKIQFSAQSLCKNKAIPNSNIDQSALSKCRTFGRSEIPLWKNIAPKGVLHKNIGITQPVVKNDGKNNII